MKKFLGVFYSALFFSVLSYPTHASHQPEEEQNQQEVQASQPPIYIKYKRYPFHVWLRALEQHKAKCIKKEGKWNGRVNRNVQELVDGVVVNLGQWVGKKLSAYGGRSCRRITPEEITQLQDLGLRFDRKRKINPKKLPFSEEAEQKEGFSGPDKLYRPGRSLRKRVLQQRAVDPSGGAAVPVETIENPTVKREGEAEPPLDVLGVDAPSRKPSAHEQPEQRPSAGFSGAPMIPNVPLNNPSSVHQAFYGGSPYFYGPDFFGSSFNPSSPFNGMFFAPPCIVFVPYPVPVNVQVEEEQVFGAGGSGIRSSLLRAYSSSSPREDEER